MRSSIIALVAFCLSQTVYASDILSRVVSVADGDTITVLDSKKGPA